MPAQPPLWHVYVLECGDGSLYTGIARDVARRLAEHASGKGAKYTRGRGPLSVVAEAGPMNHGDALRLEATTKRRKGAAKLVALQAASGQSGPLP